MRKKLLIAIAGTLGSYLLHFPLRLLEDWVMGQMEGWIAERLGFFVAWILPVIIVFGAIWLGYRIKTSKIVPDVAEDSNIQKEQTNYIDKIIVDTKAQDLLAIPNALQDLSSLDIELTNKLSLIKRSKAKLINTQAQLRKDWSMKPSEAYGNLSEKIIKQAINQTAKRMKLQYTRVNEDTMMFMMHVAGVLDDNNAGLSELREKDEHYHLVNTLKAKVATQELKNAIRVYTWYSLGINSILLLVAYFPTESVRQMMKMLGKTPTELKAEREQTLGFLLTDVANLLERELHGKRK